MNESVVSALREQLKRTPRNTALYDGFTFWSYEELHEAADRIAGRLSLEGIGPGDRVGVSMPRTNDAVAAIVGVLVAGAAYVPLDPGYPPDRLAHMCDRAEVRVVLGPPELTERLTTDAMRLDPSGAAKTWEASRSRPPLPDPKSAAYVLFTSGSTGLPKGVQVSHQNLVALLRWTKTAFSPSEFAVSALDAPFSFDLSVFEMFAPLTLGGMIRLLPNALSMGDLRPTDPITIAFATPSALGELVRAGRLPASLRTLMVGGEVFPSSLADQILKHTSVTRLMNIYGPTETTVLTTAYELSLPTEDPLPIGWEIPGCHHFILDESLRPVADGAVGEIFIGGPQVSDGYLNDPARTAERFIDWHHGPGPAQRVYKSGDLGRRRPDGLLEIHGRIDKQVKLRGYRIELGEIETIIRRRHGVAQAFVRLVGEGTAAKLIGYIVPDDEPVDIEDLMVELRGALTPYMVPTGIVSLPKFPLTPTGKLDEAALAPWVPTAPTATAVRGRSLDEVEETVASLMSELLRTNRLLTPGDDFIDDLGGTSLGMVQLLAIMELTFGADLPIDQVVSDTTVAGFADLVRHGGGPKSGRMIVHAEGSRSPLFLFHAYLGGILRYRRLGPYLSSDRPLIAIHGHDPRDSEARATTIEEMAERVLAQVREIQPEGPYLLGGHSAGGLIAYEVARRMAESGDDIEKLILLDSPVNSPRWRYYWAEAALNWPEIRHATRAERAARLQRVISSRMSLHRRVAQEDRVLATVERNNRLSNLACLHYVTPHYAGDLTLLRCEQGVRMAAGDRLLGWSRHVGGTITALDIDGGHNTMFDAEFVASVAGRINEVVGDALVPS